MLTGSFISKCVWGAIMPFRSQYSGLPPAAGTSAAESMLVGLPGMVIRLGSVAIEAQEVFAGISGLVAASLADARTSERFVFALATPPPELSTTISAAARTPTTATPRAVRGVRIRNEYMVSPLCVSLRGARIPRPPVKHLELFAKRTAV